MSLTADQPKLSPRRALTRGRLMAAATDIFADKGIHGASVEEICEQAGFTRGAFYSNFESKDDLCLALLRAVCDEHLRAAQEAVATSLESVHPDDALTDLVDTAIDTFVASQPSGRNTQLLQLEMRLHAVRNPEFAAMFNALDREMSTLFATLISDGLRERGVHLSLPAEQAIGLLHAIHDKAQIDVLLGRVEASAATTDLRALLRTLLRPTDDAADEPDHPRSD